MNTFLAFFIVAYFQKSCLAYATPCFTKGHSRATLKLQKKK